MTGFPIGLHGAVYPGISHALAICGVKWLGLLRSLNYVML